MNRTRTSVVMPAYNAARYLDEAIESVIAQTRPDWELIVVDDGSFDNTFALAQRYATRERRVRCVHQENGGVASARNRGLSETSAESKYVIFLDADDLWLPDTLEALVDGAESSSALVGAHGLGRFIDGRGELIRLGQCEDMCRPRPTVVDGHVVSTPVDAPTTHAALIVGGCIVAPGAVLMRRSVVRDIAGFDPAFQVCADWDIYIRLTRHGPLRFLNRVVLSYRQHEANMSADGARQRVEQRYVLSKALASSGDDMAPSIRQLYRTAQWFYIGEKLRLVAGCLRRRDPWGAARQVAYSAGHARRFVTGRP